VAICAKPTNEHQLDLRMNAPTLLTWSEKDTPRSALWRSDQVLPKTVVLADDTMTADTAYRLACAGTGLLWRSDFQNARLLLQAMMRRLEKPAKRKTRGKNQADAPVDPATGFHAHRLAQSQRARVLNALLIELKDDYSIALRRAPDVKQACNEAWGRGDGQNGVVPLRILQGLIGAHEWRKNGVEVAALGGNDQRIHPHYGVFSPVRGEYVDLVAKTPLPAALQSTSLAFDIGTGTGVLSAVLVRRGIERVVATDMSDRALSCAKDNLQRLELTEHVELLKSDVFPPGQAALVVCNPPWLPARPTSLLEQAVYDEGSQMLKGFLAGLASHLSPGGEGWLILSDLAEHLGLRTRAELQGWIDEAGLKVLGRVDTLPRHAKAQDATDPLHAARSAEVTSLWRLAAA
jgi:methylase of polypeptide subunit release factors